MLYCLASHLSVLRERESEESKCEEGDESEFEPLAKRPYSTRRGRYASSFILKDQHFEINEQQPSK